MELKNTVLLQLHLKSCNDFIYKSIQRYQLNGPTKPAFLDLGPEIEDISDNKIVQPKSHAFTAKITPSVTYLITIINSLMTRREIIFKAN